jgi:single-strand DNA-binding protein
MSYSKTIIVGNLGRDPELRYTQSGDPVCGFSVAVSRKWTDKGGTAQEETTWYNVSVFGAQAEPCSKYLAKGRQVLVDGDVKARAYANKDGTPGASLDLKAHSVQFLGGRDDSGTGQSEEPVVRPTQRAANTHINLNTDEPIPF